MSRSSLHQGQPMLKLTLAPNLDPRSAREVLLESTLVPQSARKIADRFDLSWSHRMLALAPPQRRKMLDGAASLPWGKIMERRNIASPARPPGN